jgi:diaminopimelate epimerase
LPTVDFWKYEGTANDFILIESEDARADLDPGLVAKLCDRHRGVGADGVLLVTPGVAGGQARMIVRNADGSRPEMCGNGLRCVALHVATRRADPGVLTIETDAGLRTCRVDATRAEGGDAEFYVTVDMGVIRVAETLHVPFQDRAIDLVAVDAGNPHAVAFEGLDDNDVDVLGAQLQLSEFFPQGVNLERVVMQGSLPGAAMTAGVSVYERGVGRTMACGTGACAVAAALVARGLAKVGDKLVIVLPGGPLEIILDENGRASMRGRARRVFAGRVAIAETAFLAGVNANQS